MKYFKNFLLILLSSIILKPAMSYAALNTDYFCEIIVSEQNFNSPLIDNFPKFILIDSADDLNISSSNALLKILEEPKKNTYFFLISHHHSSLLPTIKSRCLKLQFPTHNYNDFEKILISNNLKYDDELLKLLFDITNGSPGISFEYNVENFIDLFSQLKNSLIGSDIFSNENNIQTEITNLVEGVYKFRLEVDDGEYS